jgi:Flp pilus assembly protein CpaB
MSRRVLLLVALIVIIIGAAVAFLVLPNMNRNPTPASGTPAATRVASDNGTAQPTTIPPSPIPTVNIVVAVQPIGRGQVISPDMVDFREWPEQFAPRNSIFSLEEVIGRIARTDIEREQPILTGLITRNLNDLGAEGSDAAAIMPPGTRMVSIPIDMLTSNAYAIQPGDRVDAIISLLFVDVDEEFQTRLPNDIIIVSPLPDGGFQILQPVDGRIETAFLAGQSVPILIGPTELPRPRLTTQMTVQDALVVNTGLFPDDGRLFGNAPATPVPAPEDVQATPGTTRADGTPVPTPVPERPNVISLAVSPQDAVTLSYYVEARIPVTFVLRPANETGTVTTQAVTLDYVMTRYGIQVPRKLPYGLEPAIRSIRRLLDSDEIIFQEADPAATTTTTTGQ